MVSISTCIDNKPNLLRDVYHAGQLQVLTVPQDLGGTAMAATTSCRGMTTRTGFLATERACQALKLAQLGAFVGGA